MNDEERTAWQNDFRFIIHHSAFHRCLLLLLPLATTLPDPVSTAQRQSADGRGGVHRGAGGERASVHDKEVFDLMRLVPGVHYRVSRVIAHARRAHEVEGGVNNPAVKNLHRARSLQR